jgi:hypothetical protein
MITWNPWRQERGNDHKPSAYRLCSPRSQRGLSRIVHPLAAGVPQLVGTWPCLICSELHECVGVGIRGVCPRTHVLPGQRLTCLLARPAVCGACPGVGRALLTADPRQGLTPRTRPGRQRAIAGSCRPARWLPAMAPGGRPCCVGLPGRVMAPNPGDEGFSTLGQENWSQPIEQPFPHGERPTVNNLARAGTALASKAGAMPSRQPQPSQPTRQVTTSAVG